MYNLLKGDIVDYKFNGEDFSAYIKKNTKYGTFEATVRPCAADMITATVYDGFLFAEKKCDLKALKAKKSQFKKEYLAAIAAVNLNEKDPYFESDIYFYPVAKQYRDRYIEAAKAYDKAVKDFDKFVEERLEIRRDFRAREEEE